MYFHKEINLSSCREKVLPLQQDRRIRNVYMDFTCYYQKI